MLGAWLCRRHDRMSGSQSRRAVPAHAGFGRRFAFRSFALRCCGDLDVATPALRNAVAACDLAVIVLVAERAGGVCRTRHAQARLRLAALGLAFTGALADLAIGFATLATAAIGAAALSAATGLVAATFR